MDMRSFGNDIYMLNESLLDDVEFDEVVDNDSIREPDKFTLTFWFGNCINRGFLYVLERVCNASYENGMHVSYQIHFHSTNDENNFIDVTFEYTDRDTILREFVSVMMYIIHMIKNVFNMSVRISTDIEGYDYSACILDIVDEVLNVNVDEISDMFGSVYASFDIIEICAFYAFKNDLLDETDGYYTMHVSDDFYLIVDNRGLIVYRKYISCPLEGLLITFVYDNRLIGIRNEGDLFNILDVETGQTRFDKWVRDILLIKGTDIVAYKEENQRWTLADIKTMKTLMTGIVFLSDQYEDGFFLIQHENGTGKSGYDFIDKNCNFLTQSFFVYAQPFHNGYAIVDNGKGRTYIDTNGRFVTNDTFESCENFECGRAKVEIACKTRKKYSYIDTNGEYINDTFFSDCKDFKDGLAIVEDSGGWFVIDIDGKSISERFDSIGDFENGYALVHDGDVGWNFIDTSGELIVGDWFEKVCTGFNEFGYAVVEHSNQTKVINTSGEFVGDFGNCLSDDESIQKVVFSFGNVFVFYIQCKDDCDKIDYYVPGRGFILNEHINVNIYDFYYNLISNPTDRHMVIVDNDKKFNIVNVDGEILLDEWTDDAIYITGNGLLKVGMNSQMDYDGRLVLFI